MKLGTGSQNDITYSVQVTIGGVSDLFKVTTVSIINELNQLNQNSLTLYPNPTTGLINISGNPESGSLEIFNIAGQKVKSETIQNSSDYQINMAKYTHGIYLIKYFTKSKVYHGQIVLKSN